MKKLFWILSLVLFIFSCSKDTEIRNDQVNVIDNVTFTKSKQSVQNGAFIDEVEAYISDKSKGYKKSIEKRFGEIYWDYGIVSKSETDDQIYTIIPLVNEKKEYTNALMIGYRRSSNDKLKFYFIKKNALDKLQRKSEIDFSKKATDIPYENALLNFLNFDQQIFGSVDCELADRAKEVFESFSSEDITKSTICYAIIDIYTNAWYQYNPITDTWELLSETTSYNYIGDLCIDIGLDGIPSGNTSGGGSSSGSTSGFSTTTIVVDGPPIQQFDLLQRLNCFNTTSNSSGDHSVTIYVDQPVPNNSNTYTTGSGSGGSSKDKSDVDVGHTFINLTQTINGTSRSFTFGFYPLGGVSPTNPNAIGTFVDDGGHVYDVGLSIDISPYEFNQLISGIQGLSQYSNYNLDNRNCSDFGIDALSIISINLDDTYGSWPFGGGTNPGNLGQDIRSMNISSTMTRDLDGGIAKSTSNCN